jgi:putative transposase
VKIAKSIRGLGEVNGFEGLDKGDMLIRSHSWNRRIADTDWRGIAARVSMGGGTVEVDPRLTSRTCSRCGCADGDLRGAVFECEACGLRIDRQLNAAVNIYMRYGGRSPRCRMVGRDRLTRARGWVRPDGGGAEGPR